MRAQFQPFYAVRADSRRHRAAVFLISIYERLSVQEILKRVNLF